MVSIKIPATSANLGSGFDSLGLAINLYNTVDMQQADGIYISSSDGSKVPRGESNLIYRTSKRLFEECGKQFTGLEIVQTNGIPMTRGLGSSSACIVGGLLGANRLMGDALSQSELINYAASLEGHPDNSTPALMGGLVTSVLDKGIVHCVKQEIHGNLKLIAFIPDFKLSTEKARACLPKTIPHSDAVFNLSRAALMSVSLYSGAFENLKCAADDRLHQQHRIGMIKFGSEIFDTAYNLGAYAVYISGAGPTIMAMVDGADDSFEIRAKQTLEQNKITGYLIKTFEIDNRGATVA